MYLKALLFGGLLLLCGFYKIHCQAEEGAAATEAAVTPAADVTTGAEGTTEAPDGATTPGGAANEAKMALAEGPPTERPKSPEATDAPPADDSSQCKRICTTNKGKKYQNHCIAHKYKAAEKSKSREECQEKCKRQATCESATYIGPRSVTTLDLKNLFNNVLNHENWVPVKKPDSLIEYYNEYGSDLKKNRRRGRGDDDDGEEEYTNFSFVNSSALKMMSEIMGTCYIFDEKLSVEERLECTKSHLTFIYEDIDCLEDPNCVIPRKECSRGKCGPRCRDYNYIHLPNACLGKYYFGHQESPNLESCLDFCIANPECKSIDFGNMGSCLINYVTRNDSQLLVGCDNKNNEIWDYYEVINDSECPHEKPKPSPNEDTCANVPGICKNGGFCEPIQNDPPHQSFTYGCQCPCNYCGKHCDKLNMKTYRNGCLNTSVLVWSVAENNGDCLDMCLNEKDCKSISYSGTSGTCILHWGDLSSETIVPAPQCPSYRSDITDKEWTYHEIICDTKTCHSSVEVIESKDKRGCASNPCLNGGECADIFQRGKLLGFHCLCKCGYCGNRCESHNFNGIPDACIWGSHISDSPIDYYRKSVPLSTCFNVCAAKYPICRSVDYSNKGECLLNNRDSDIATVSKNCNNYLRQKWTLYDLSCTCNNKPVLY